MISLTVKPTPIAIILETTKPSSAVVATLFNRSIDMSACLANRQSPGVCNGDRAWKPPLNHSTPINIAGLEAECFDWIASGVSMTTTASATVSSPRSRRALSATAVERGPQASPYSRSVRRLSRVERVRASANAATHVRVSPDSPLRAPQRAGGLETVSRGFGSPREARQRRRAAGQRCNRR